MSKRVVSSQSGPSRGAPTRAKPAGPARAGSKTTVRPLRAAAPPARKKKSRSRSQRRKTTTFGRGLGRVAELIARPSEDAWGWTLLVVGVLAGLGIHFNVLGPAGHLLRRESARALGWGADVVPASLAVGGVILLAGRARRGLTGVLAAFVLLLVVSAGLADLAAGSPATGASWARLGGAGGIAGAAVGGELAKVIGVAGASVVLAGWMSV